jgi:hypothetical protein
MWYDQYPLHPHLWCNPRDYDNVCDVSADVCAQKWENCSCWHRRMQHCANLSCRSFEILNTVSGSFKGVSNEAKAIDALDICLLWCVVVGIKEAYHHGFEVNWYVHILER